jgi:hypothetical protein
VETGGGERLSERASEGGGKSKAEWNCEWEVLNKNKKILKIQIVGKEILAVKVRMNDNRTYTSFFNSMQAFPILLYY